MRITFDTRLQLGKSALTLPTEKYLFMYVVNIVSYKHKCCSKDCHRYTIYKLIISGLRSILKFIQTIY